MPRSWSCVAALFLLTGACALDTTGRFNPEDATVDVRVLPDAESADAGSDGSIDAAPDADAERDGGPSEAGADASADASFDATIDAAADSGFDAAMDAPLDAAIDATMDGAPPDAGSTDAGSPDAAACGDASVATCIGDLALRSCVAGMWTMTSCALACGGSPAACREMVPSNVGTRVAFDAGDAVWEIGDGGPVIWEVNTDAGEIIEYRSSGTLIEEHLVRASGTGTLEGIHFRTLPAIATGGVELGVFVVDRVHVRACSVLRFVGRRAAVVMARRVLVEGRVEATPSRSVAGAGGYSGATAETLAGGPGAGPNGAASLMSIEGGGGGGFGSAGGAGGHASTRSAFVDDPDLVPLFGGSGGGLGGADGGDGGGGGGAIQLSATEWIEVDDDTCGATGLPASIDVSGGGGRGALSDVSGDAGGGGGGGSGGALLLEAPAVTVAGWLGANGGGGGAGSRGPALAGADGASGCVPPFVAGLLRCEIPAEGGVGTSPGGAGGAGSNLDGVPEDGDGTFKNGGGGGGGAGRIRINTLLGAESFSARVSPSQASGLLSVGTITLVP